MAKISADATTKKKQSGKNVLMSEMFSPFFRLVRENLESFFYARYQKRKSISVLKISHKFYFVQILRLRRKSTKLTERSVKPDSYVGLAIQEQENLQNQKIKLKN